MDWLLILFFSLLFISVTLIVIALASLPKFGDERKNLIKMRAQSYTFTVVIGYILIKIGKNIYRTNWGNGSYEGINPFTFLLTFSVIYLIALLFTKKKYGG